MLFLGTSGWSYQEWVGTFYPTNAVKLKYYANYFNSVEVDSSFYKLPSKQMVSGWLKNTPSGFKFSFKLPRTITHEKRTVGCEGLLAEFIEIIEFSNRLSKLGCILIQLPPSFTYSEKSSLEKFLNLLPTHFQFAIEFRHISWDRSETWEILRRHNVANTITDSPLKFLSAINLTSETHAFIRWHGRGKSPWYDYKYSLAELNPWLSKVSEIEKHVQDVYAYFNNHYRAAAPYNALQFLESKGTINTKQKLLKSKFNHNSTGKISDFF